MGVQSEIKKTVYFKAHQLAGIDIGSEYRRYLLEDRDGVNHEETTRRLLVAILDHCKKNVPYYFALMEEHGNSYRQDPFGYLSAFPILTKDIIRVNFNQLKSNDLERRKWRYTTTGGSTGDPAIFIQDNEFLARAGAIQWLSHEWAGRKFGEPGVRVWGSTSDVLKGTMGLKMKAINYLTNDAWFNAFRMSPERMRSFLKELNDHPPRLIIAYVQAIYELARFAEEENILIHPQQAILTSAGTLYPFMREKIEAIFQCEVFNRYGSRELGDIASECEEHRGLHVFPWGSYVEIVDDDGYPVEPGVEGNIVVTSLSNYAMPLIRYFIGDRGILSQDDHCLCGRSGQILEKVTGRVTDMFVKKDGTRIDGGYFAFLLHNRDWVHRFQIIQHSHSSILFRIVRTTARETPHELDEIIQKTKYVMGPDVEVSFEFIEDLLPSPSGKYLYLKSEVDS